MSENLPTSEDVKTAGQFLTASLDFLRLRWFARTPASTAISVLDSAVDATSAQQPYYDPSRAGGVHSVAESPASDPPVSPLGVTLAPLDRYEEDWDDAHHQHSGEFAASADGRQRRVRCCGEGRPGPGPHPDVQASAELFVTIHDIVEAVHPWMLGLEDRIRAARGVARGRPLPAEFDMFVYPNKPHQLDIRDTRRAGPGLLEGTWKLVARFAAARAAWAQNRAAGGA